ncbi:MAG: manganese efflux pump [Alphaproteobacteria bacterium]|nr:manganese efflux pump [Alphaproteobacteria bacterium]
MGFLEILILAVGLSMDAFAVSICKGLSLQKISLKDMSIVGTWFGFFQALMPCFGYYGGRIFTADVQHYGHWIAFCLLCIIGAKMLYEAVHTECDANQALDFRTMFLLAVATSIDELAVGISFAVLAVDLWTAISIIGITTFLFSAIGLIIGNIFGSRWKRRSEICGGLILIAIGINILLNN